MQKALQLVSPLDRYVSDFLKENYSRKTYLLVALFLAITITINYYLDFESVYIRRPDFFARWVSYILFYGFAYFIALLLMKWAGEKLAFLKSTKFWLLSIFGLVIISLDGSFKFSYSIAKSIFEPEEYRYIGRLIYEGKPFFLVFLPLLVMWNFTRIKGDSFYGLSRQSVSYRPYILILLFMFPLMLLAISDPEFLTTYPKFKTFGVEQYWGVNIKTLILPFESLYAWSFFTTELFFRGFLVIGMMRIMGTHAILPMVCMYAFLHFEKPVAETIGSVFGGFLLGAIAYKSKNIWGGVFVHIGVAMMMELIAYWGNL
ncbi:MAG: CPBP family intramembrane glutamic endopeptidase [Salibacteraceae bacterium]